MTDEHLVQALKQGQTEVLKHLYVNFPMIRNYILTNNGEMEDAEDIFQDTLMVFYKNVMKDAFELRSQIKTYLYGISKNLWLKKLRDRKIDFMSAENNEEAVEGIEYEFEDYRAGDHTEQLIQLVDQMGNPCKALLINYYFKSLSLKTIADLMDYKSDQVARQQKYRCIQQLRQMANKLNIYSDQ